MSEMTTVELMNENVRLAKLYNDDPANEEVARAYVKILRECASRDDANPGANAIVRGIAASVEAAIPLYAKGMSAEEVLAALEEVEIEMDEDDVAALGGVDVQENDDGSTLIAFPPPASTQE